VRPELRWIEHEAVREAKPGAHFLEVGHAVVRESLAQGGAVIDDDLFRGNVQQPDNVDFTYSDSQMSWRARFDRRR